ncbi:putative F-box protein At1g19160 isoform X1 [Ananas comosus]|uniref:F-box protein At1g19160 isoform X1 n=2 Tax=Ananas comosus TaxID=4615 RepID=A0A6P5GE92_ANACO|nr:putative F-box protein At1g19160 isoform X1 [Ananas comosus]CAD1820164.1 unnamed protein product [Ananas comosus var. bracteatus]
MDLHQVRKLEPTCKLVSKVKEPSLGILEEILSRLPTKSVLRLSCVSKLWHSIVSDPHFCNLHATRALVRDNHRSMLLIEGPVIENNSGTRIKTLFTGSEANLHGSAICHIVKCNTYFYNGTCNGLLIFRCDVAPEPIILCNPVTREYLYLSAGAPPFHDLESYFGLGFDPLRKVYKVFRFSLSRHSRKKDICEVYTLGSHGSWRRVCSDVEHFIFGPGLYIGGKIFWTTISYRHPYYMKIMSADVVSEEIRILKPPVTASFLRIDALNQIRTFDFEGQLAMMAGKISNELAELWVLKDYEHNQWEHLYTYKLPFSANFRKTSVCVNNKFLFVLQPGYKLAIYDTRKSSFENNSAPQSCYCVLPDVPKHWRIYGDYKPSLVSLKSFCGTRGILAATTDPILQGDHGEEEKSKTAFLRELHYILRETMSQDD